MNNVVLDTTRLRAEGKHLQHVLQIQQVKPNINRNTLNYNARILQLTAK
jgi:hypothetical protein